MALQVKRPIFDTDDEASTVSAVVEEVKSEIDEVLRSRQAQPALASRTKRRDLLDTQDDGKFAHGNRPGNPKPAGDAEGARGGGSARSARTHHLRRHLTSRSGLSESHWRELDEMATAHLHDVQIGRIHEANSISGCCGCGHARGDHPGPSRLEDHPMVLRRL
jgi:hypothetical protein